MLQIDGSDIVRWLASAKDSEMVLLNGAEYADDSDVWTILETTRGGLSIVGEDSTRRVMRPLGFFQGTFFVTEDIGARLNDLIRGTQTEGERKIARSKEYLASVGFPVSELGGDTVALFLAQTIENFRERGVAPDDVAWTRIQEIFDHRSASVMRSGAKLVAEWVADSERKAGGLIDAYRRVLLAYLFRHSGQLDKALEVSEVVNLPQTRFLGGNSTIAVLCTTRAAALMDKAELTATERTNLLKDARMSLNKANAIGGGESSEVREAYMRLKRLDQRQA